MLLGTSFCTVGMTQRLIMCRGPAALCVGPTADPCASYLSGAPSPDLCATHLVRERPPIRPADPHATHTIPLRKLLCGRQFGSPLRSACTPIRSAGPQDPTHSIRGPPAQIRVPPSSPARSPFSGRCLDKKHTKQHHFGKKQCFSSVFFCFVFSLFFQYFFM